MTDTPAKTTSQERLTSPRVMGLRLAEARAAANLSQDQMARKIGVPCHHLQKCEAGLKRLSPEMTVLIAKVLDVPIRQLFLQDENEPDRERYIKKLVGDAFRLMRDFMRIDDPTTRESVLQFIKSIADNFSRPKPIQ